MLRSYWGEFTALGVVLAATIVVGLLTWPTQPTLQTYGEEKPRSGHYRPGGEHCQPSTLMAIRDGRKRTSQTQGCQKEAEEYRLQTNDLIQQMRAANGAEAQAEIASQSLWMTFFQTIGGLLTLAAAGAAAFYARDAAQAGKDSLDHARSVSHSELRPWIQISVEPKSAYNDSDAVKVYCNATLKNLGRTPAQDVWVGTTAADIPTSYYKRYGPQETYSLPREGMERWQPILPGGEITRLVSFEVKWEDAEAPFLRSGDKHMCPYFGVHASYALGENRRGETVATFQIGFDREDDLFGSGRDIGGFVTSDKRTLEPLRVQPGVRAKIT